MWIHELAGVTALVHRGGIPRPPVDMHVSATNQAVFTLLCAIPSAYAIALAVVAVVKNRDYVWPLFLAGGLLGVAVEPLLDLFGGVWWPTHGDWRIFTIVGVNVPLLVVMVYPWILGGQAYLAYRCVAGGMTRRRLWQLVLLFSLTDIAIETAGINGLHVYAYFGRQPLNLWGLPLWYVPCNAIGPIVAAVLFHLLRGRLTGPRSVLLVAVLPMGFLGTYAMIGFPNWLSLNSDWPPVAAQLCGVATLLLGYLLVTAIDELTATQPHPAAGPRGPSASEQRDGPATVIARG